MELPSAVLLVQMGMKLMVPLPPTVAGAMPSAVADSVVAPELGGTAKANAEAGYPPTVSASPALSA